jgi:Uma2 family endonuclease
MSTTLTTRRFTVEEYYRMAEVGILEPGERVELIEGEIVRMAAIGSPHSGTVIRLNRLLTAGAGDRALVSVQNPVRLGRFSEPQPDVALLRPRDDDYTTAHPGPGEVLLVVEVADTTLDYDREVKAPLYAAAGIPEYWLVNLVDDAVEVYRQPEEGGYRESDRLKDGEVLRLSRLPGLELPVDEVLP